MELTIEQAYAAAYLMVADRHHRMDGVLEGRRAEDLEAFLFAMYLGGPRLTSDPGFWGDWVRSVREIIGDFDEETIRLTEREAYDATIAFLRFWYVHGGGDADMDIGALMREMEVARYDGSGEVSVSWRNSLERALRDHAKVIMDAHPW